MNQMVGYLIRSNRIKQKMSQEQLCKGICAVSYLSKIEAGIAEPNRDILKKLFEILGIDYEQNEEQLEEYRVLFYRYFDAFFHHESCAEIEEKLYANRKKMENSELAIEYQLFCIYNVGTDDRHVAERLLKNVERYRDYMSEDTSFLYYIAKGMYDKTEEERVAAYRKARQIKDCSLVYESLMYEAFYAGRYQEAIDYCRSGYARAMEEGFLLVAKQISFLEGVCYGKLGDIKAMLTAYKRTRELSRGDDKLRAGIDYNIANAYVEQQQYEEAIPHFLSALKLEQDTETAFYINHKLALAYEYMNDKTVGSIYLEVASRLAQNLKPIHQLMIRMARLRYETDYVESKEYEHILFQLFSMKKEMGDDFVTFYQPYVVEWYKKKRKYKEALRLVTGE